MYLLRYSFGRIPTPLIHVMDSHWEPPAFYVVLSGCSCRPYITWRGSLSVSDTIILILFSKWASSISRRSERKPRSVLLCSQRMTLIPWEAASRTSWWDISPANKRKSKYLNMRHSLWTMVLCWTITAEIPSFHPIWSKRNTAELTHESRKLYACFLHVLQFKKRDHPTENSKFFLLGKCKASIQIHTPNSI